MTNFEDFKQKAKDTMETIADKSVELYKIAEEKTKLFAKITKLGAEIALEKGTVRKLYREIGKKYYDIHKASPEEALMQSCTEVTASLECIAAKQKEIEELKNSYNLDEKDISVPDTEESDVEVEIIIEDFEAPEEAPTVSVDDPVRDLILDDTAGEADDIISKNPPEFTI